MDSSVAFMKFLEEEKERMSGMLSNSGMDVSELQKIASNFPGGLKGLLDDDSCTSSGTLNNAKKEQKPNKANPSKDDGEPPTRLENWVNLKEKSNDYTKAGKYEEAYGLLYRLVLLGENASFVPVLINYYVALISTGDYDTADVIKDELVENLRDNLGATAKECELLGDRYQKQKQYIKSILLYQVGEALINGIETDEMINCLQGCALGLKISVSKLVKVRPDLRSIVAGKVVPAMRCIFKKLCGIMVAPDEKMVLVQSLCLHHIETTELRAGDSAVRENTLKEAIALMDEKFGEKACEHKLYSCHLNNLGVTCMFQNKAKEAEAHLHRAIAARETAKDYDTELEMQADLAMSVSALESAKEMIQYMHV